MHLLYQCVFRCSVYDFFFYFHGDHLYLHVLTHSFPTRRSSDLDAVLHRGQRIEELALADDLRLHTVLGGQAVHPDQRRRADGVEDRVVNLAAELAAPACVHSAFFLPLAVRRADQMVKSVTCRASLAMSFSRALSQSSSMVMPSKRAIICCWMSCQIGRSTFTPISDPSGSLAGSTVPSSWRTMRMISPTEMRRRSRARR